jgi:hypothetical protein
VLLSSTGLLARTGTDRAAAAPTPRHRAARIVVSAASRDRRGEVAAVTNRGA